LEFEIADNSNLVKKGPIQPNRPNQNRTQKNQPHRKRNQQKKPRNDHRNSDKNDIRSPKVNSNGERRRRGGGPTRGKQNRQMNKGENDPRTQPGHPSYKSHPVQEQRPLSSPSPIHQQPDPRQMSHSPQPGSATVHQHQQPTPAIVNPQAMGANAGYGYPLMHQNLQAHQAHLIPSYPPTQSHIPPAAGFVTPNATVPQAQNVLFHTFPTMQAHQLVHQQMFPYQQLQASGMPQQSHMQPPSNGGYASSVSSYGSPGPSPAQLSSLQQSGGDEIAAVREKYEREIQALQEQLGVFRLENEALKQLVTSYKATLEQQSQQFLQMQQQQMQQQQRMQMQMQNQQLMQMQPQMQPQPQMHPQPVPQANQPNQI